MEITPAELKTYAPGSYAVLDIRPADELSYGTIPGAVHFERTRLQDTPPEDREKLYVLCARNTEEGLKAAETLERTGRRAAALSGGYGAWVLEDLKDQSGESIRETAERSLRKKFRKPIWGAFTKALKLYHLVNEGDCVAVCISGGKDSMLLAKLFQELERYSDVPFTAKYICMDPGYSPANRQIIEENARNLGIPIQFFETDIFSSVFNVEKNPCYLCARMRRGYLYSFASKLGCNKIALGHHYDDVIETILMSMLYGSQIQSMMPKCHSENYGGMELIRPMYFVREDDIRRWRDYNGLHFLQCACRFTEENISLYDEKQQNSKRLEAKKLIRELKKTNPDIEAHIFRSMENVNIDMVLSYKQNGVMHSFLDDYDKKEQKNDT